MAISTPTKLSEKLKTGAFTLTAEVTPPVSGDPAQLLAKVAVLGGSVDAINVTDGPNALVHMSSLASASILAANGIEPIMQMTGRDRNRLALQADLLGAAALGVHNFLMLTGDDPKAGDQPEAKPVFDYKSLDLVKVATGIARDGQLPSGREVKPRPEYVIGVADSPIDPPADWQPTALLEKAAAGADFVQTQFCFDIDIIRRYIARLNDFGVTEKLAILIGIGPLASARSARWMRDNLWGVIMPDHIIDRLEQAEDPKQEGILVCAELLNQLAEIKGVAGAHLMAPIGASGVPLAIAEAKLDAKRHNAA